MTVHGAGKNGGRYDPSHIFRFTPLPDTIKRASGARKGDVSRHTHRKRIFKSGLSYLRWATIRGPPFPKITIMQPGPQRAKGTILTIFLGVKIAKTRLISLRLVMCKSLSVIIERIIGARVPVCMCTITKKAHNRGRSTVGKVGLTPIEAVVWIQKRLIKITPS